MAPTGVTATLWHLRPKEFVALPAVRFHVLGVPVEIRASFLLLVAVLGIERHLNSLVLAWLPIATVAVLVHEAGHAAAFRAFGIAPRTILHGGGGVTFGGDPGAHRRIILYLAGPLAGVLLGVVVVTAARAALPAGPTTQALIDDVLFATLGWSLINLLPVGGFDGHAILKDVLRVALGHPAVLEIRFIGVCTIIVLALGAIALGAYEAAFFIVFLAIMSATPLDGVMGGPSRSRAGRPAGELLMHGHNEEALAASDAALLRNPADTDALLDRATTLRLMTRYEEAEAAYSQLLERKPDLRAALSGRAMVRAALGRREDARADLAALGDEPTSARTGGLDQVIGLYVSQRYDEASVLVETNLASGDLDPTARARLTGMQPLLNEALGLSELALQQVDAALRDRPDDMTLHEVRALILIGLGRGPEAVRSAKRALSVAPRNPELLETMGIAERFAGHPEAALPHLLAAAIARPALPRARAELSACFTQLDRLDEAQDALEALPELARQDPFVRYAEACLLGRRQQSGDAAERLGEAVRTRPGLGRRAKADPVLDWLPDEWTPANAVPATSQVRASA